MIEFIMELIGGWLQHGSDKGVLGRIRRWLLIAVIVIFVCMLTAAYFANLSTMSLGLVIGLPIFAFLFGSIFAIYFYAIRRKARKDD